MTLLKNTPLRTRLWERCELKTEVSGLLPQTRFSSDVGLLVALYENTLRVWFLRGKQVIDDPGKLVGSRCDRLRRTKPPLHFSIDLAEIVLSVIQTVCAESERNRCSVLHLPSARVKNLPSANLLFRAEPQPGCDSGAITKTRDICANFYQDGMCSKRADAGHICQVYARNSF